MLFVEDTQITHQSIDFEELEKLKVAELKVLCKERGLKVSGKKSELHERLVQYAASAPSLQHQVDQKSVGATSGILQETSTRGFYSSDLNGMTMDDLRQALTVRGVDTEGSRETLLSRLLDDVEHLNSLKNSVVLASPDECLPQHAAIEIAARDGGSLAKFIAELEEKEKRPSKKVNVTVTSLGLTPIAFTASGAPSATAAVLSKLAGDPFADPPIYGAVSLIDSFC
jgi:hypothetical protein